MASRLLVACFLSAVLAFLLLLSSGSKVEAVTYRVNYTPFTLSCRGPDGVSVNTTLTANADAGTNAITVASTDSMFTGVVLTIGPPNTETAKIVTVNTTTKVVTLQTNLANNHLSGDPVTAGLGDDSCTAGTAYALDSTADLATTFQIPQTSWSPANPDYANFDRINTFHAPPEWGLAPYDVSPIGSYAGLLYAQSTLSIAGSACPTSPNIPAPIPMYHCSTDNSVANQIAWTGDGSNLTADSDLDGIPDGCEQYPSYVDTMAGGRKPYARLYGYETIVLGAPPTQINFVVFQPAQLTMDKNGVAITTSPDKDLGDSLGYSNQVILDNPIQPVTISTITDFCTPLSTNTFLWGETGGEGKAIPSAGAGPELGLACLKWQGTNQIQPDGGNGGDSDGDTVADDGCWVVTDWCGDGVDNDGDTTADEMCGVVTQHNPNAAVGGATSGLFGTGTHLIGVFTESYRDADNDGFTNDVDACPYQVGTTDDINGCDGCPGGACPAASCTPLDNDCDNDGYTNRQDRCPFMFDDQTDADRDYIGAACDNNDSSPDGVFVNTEPRGATCVGSTDTDGDGWCDSTEDLLATDAAGGQCANATDDDAADDNDVGKVWINDGCPAIGAPETGISTGGQCASGNNTDDDGDGFVNDGCPVVHEPENPSTPEDIRIDYPVSSAVSPPGTAPVTCANQTYYASAGDPHAGGVAAIDDDGDTYTNAADIDCQAGAVTGDDDNDGIATDPVSSLGADVAGDHAGAEVIHRDTTITARTYTYVPATGQLHVGAHNPAQTTLTAGNIIGDTVILVASTGGFTPNASITLAAGTAREETAVVDTVDSGVQMTLKAGLAKAKNVGDTVSTASAPDAKMFRPKDLDGDGELEAVLLDPGLAGRAIFTADIDSDTDPDIYWIGTGGLDPGDVDNCPTVPNPDQLNIDGDATGDACDTEDDGDGLSDYSEWKCGWNAKDACSPFDQNNDHVVNVLDILLYKAELGTPGSKPTFDGNCDGTVNVLDILLYKGALGAGGNQCPYHFG